MSTLGASVVRVLKHHLLHAGGRLLKGRILQQSGLGEALTIEGTTVEESAPVYYGVSTGHQNLGDGTAPGSYEAAHTTPQPQLTWEAAPSCTATPTPGNSVKDSNGRLWGWENNASCAYKTASTPVYTHETAPGCGPTAAKAGFRTQDNMGYTWGYEDGHSCLFRVRIGLTTIS
jgi:hypothetical protein